MVDMITVSDANYNYSNMRYISSSVEETVFKLNGLINSFKDNSRAVLEFKMDNTALRFIRPSIEDKVADIIAVNYKYAFFKKRIRTSGLNYLENELLLTALISADLDEDKKYIRAKIRGSNNYSIDGAFNFTMRSLKDKWTEIVGYIPPYFIKEQLKEFVAYLIKDKAGRRVYVDKGKVYDRHFNKLTRCQLTSDNDDARIVREVILSASGEVELSGEVPQTDEYYLKQFFGDKVFFRRNMLY